MPIIIVDGLSLKQYYGAILNLTGRRFEPLCKNDELLYAYSGRVLQLHLKRRGYLRDNEIYASPAFNLRCELLFHAELPACKGDDNQLEEEYMSVYSRALAFAKDYGLDSIALPICSVASENDDVSFDAALSAAKIFAQSSELTVYLCVGDDKSFVIKKDLKKSLDSHINKELNYTHGFFSKIKCPLAPPEEYYDDFDDSYDDYADLADIFDSSKDDTPDFQEIKKEIIAMEKGFADTLFEFIDKKGMSDVECYKRANIDRKTFSKIKCNKNYRPSKETALAFAIALRLNLDETERLLNTVGMALSRSSRFDVIVKYFITKSEYDVHEINRTLFAFGQSLLG